MWLGVGSVDVKQAIDRERHQHRANDRAILKHRPSLLGKLVEVGFMFWVTKIVQAVSAGRRSGTGLGKPAGKLGSLCPDTGGSIAGAATDRVPLSVRTRQRTNP